MSDKIRVMTKQIAELQAELDKATELEELLRQLYHHHQSQAKPISIKCSSVYHTKLAERIHKVLWENLK